MTEQPNETPNVREYVTIVDVPQELFESTTPEQLAQHGAGVWLTRAEALGLEPVLEPIEGTDETSVHLKMNLRSPQLEEHYLHVSGPVVTAALKPES